MTRCTTHGISRCTICSPARASHVLQIDLRLDTDEQGTKHGTRVQVIYCPAVDDVVTLQGDTTTCTCGERL